MARTLTAELPKQGENMNRQITEDNKLLQVWRDAYGHEHIRGKRVAKDCPMTQGERELYVSSGASKIKIIAEIRKRTDSLSAACRIFCLAAYGIDNHLVNSTRHEFESKGLALGGGAFWRSHYNV